MLIVGYPGYHCGETKESNECSCHVRSYLAKKAVGPKITREGNSKAAGLVIISSSEVRLLHRSKFQLF